MSSHLDIAKALEHLAEVSDRDLLHLTNDAERALCWWSGMPHAVLTTSGLSALQAGLYAAGVGPGDEVICDAIFPFAIMATLNVGGKPVVADLDAETLTLSPVSLRNAMTPHTKAVIATAVFGVPPATTPLRNSIAESDVEPGNGEVPVVIEDHAQAFGTQIDGHPSAARPDMTCFSFHIDKPLATGYGGAVVSKSQCHETVLRRFINLGWYPRTREDGATDWERGWRRRESHCQSARLPPIVAGLLLQRLKMFPAVRREHIAAVSAIEEKLSELEGVRLQSVPAGFCGQRWRIAVICSSANAAQKLVRELTTYGSRAYQYAHPPASEWPHLKREWFDAVPNTTDLMSRIVAFPVMNKSDAMRELSALESLA